MVSETLFEVIIYIISTTSGILPTRRSKKKCVSFIVQSRILDDFWGDSIWLN